MQHNLNSKQVNEVQSLCQEISDTVFKLEQISFKLKDIDFMKSLDEETISILDNVNRIMIDLNDDSEEVQ